MADRGLCSYVHLALLVQASVHAVLRVGARQIVDFAPGRPFVRPSVRRTPAVKGIPRSRWLKMLGIHDQLVAWLKPKTRLLPFFVWEKVPFHGAIMLDDL